MIYPIFHVFRVLLFFMISSFLQYITCPRGPCKLRLQAGPGFAHLGPKAPSETCKTLLGPTWARRAHEPISRSSTNVPKENNSGQISGRSGSRTYRSGPIGPGPRGPYLWSVPKLKEISAAPIQPKYSGIISSKRPKEYIAGYK